MQDSPNNKTDKNESTEPLTAHSEQPDKPFIPPMGSRELRATWEMLVAFSSAIESNEHWTGKDVEAVAMGLNMIKRMTSQYRVQVDMADKRERDEAQKIKDQIKAGGGYVSSGK